MMNRYVTLRVAYEPDTTNPERSLGWLVPELVDAGLALTEDAPTERIWSGAIDQESYARLAEAWDLENRANGLYTGEHGPRECQVYTWDGMEWERAGVSPIVWVELEVSEPVGTELDPGRTSAVRERVACAVDRAFWGRAVCSARTPSVSSSTPLAIVCQRCWYGLISRGSRATIGTRPLQLKCVSRGRPTSATLAPSRSTLD